MKPFTIFSLTFLSCLGLGLMSVVEGIEFYGGDFRGFDLALGTKPAGLKTVKIKYFEYWFLNVRGHPLVHCRGKSAPYYNEKFTCRYSGYEEVGIEVFFCGPGRSNTGARYSDHVVYTEAHKEGRLKSLSGGHLLDQGQRLLQCAKQRSDKRPPPS
ncbi:hypothetical protein FA10DRAFT_259681 [Acaromyces ingoldii]|uniref:AA1-like domain-containing protein n=1 Tax=Acaromyces ingoldii TaxID=215250 RepID=A0A316YXI1_9BASI|nr:hypothetical protein FA10DRAFT_259681 [Acaromyces ingoldii]PWN92515.1 hypothetical protein FA10DRAFT_259681 [Acaromyces ingoldii]